MVPQQPAVRGMDVGPWRQRAQTLKVRLYNVRGMLLRGAIAYLRWFFYRIGAPNPWRRIESNSESAQTAGSVRVRRRSHILDRGDIASFAVDVEALEISPVQSIRSGQTMTDQNQGQTEGQSQGHSIGPIDLSLQAARNPFLQVTVRRDGFSGAQLRTIARANARPGMTAHFT
jgi:hypothetical protein